MKPTALLLLFLLVLGARAQDATNVSATADSDSRIELLESLYSSLTAKQQEVASLENQLKTAGNETTRAAISENLQSSAAELLELRRRFEESVTGVDHSLFVEVPEEAFS